ncbi:MAG: DNA polymerase III subunit gamma/tau [Candidatus Sumerlaeia bacterium]
MSELEIPVPESPAPSNESYIGLARKYRPATFSDLVGQDQIARALEQQLLSGARNEGQTRVSQAYIFSGPRGTGKTSSARILAKCLNCTAQDQPTPKPCGKCDQCLSISRGVSMDVIEIDGASNNKVEDIRELQETVNQNPFSARKKIYIIDEVHMLSTSAFNALLKTLEEPPPFVIFIFATTEYEKIPETIKSRCQSFQFRRISMEDLVKRLEYVAEQEKIEMDPSERRAILDAIAFAVDGGMRDALMTLDQITALSDGLVRLDDTVRFLGVVEHELLIQTIEYMHHRDTRALLGMVNQLVERGRDMERFVKNLLLFMRDLMILKSGADPEMVNLAGEKLERAKGLLWQKDENGRESEVVSYPELLNWIQVFMKLEAQIKEAVQVRIHLEFAFVKLTAVEPMAEIETMIQALASGKATRPKQAPPKQGGQGPTPPRPQAQSRPAAPQQKPPQPSTPDMFGGQRSASAPGNTPPQAPPKISTSDPQAIWGALQNNADALGMELSIAIKECTFKGLDDNALIATLPKGSLSLRSLEYPANKKRIEALLKQISGTELQFRIQQIDRAQADLFQENPADQPSRPAPRKPMQRNAAPQTDSAPMMQDSSSQSKRSESGSSKPMTAKEFFLMQSPNGKAKRLFEENKSFHDKLKMALDFFDGRLLDTDGNEITA